MTKINESGGKEIIESLNINKTLTSISICIIMVIVAGNNIGSGCGQYVSNALRNNTSLTTLELSI